MPKGIVRSIAAGRAGARTPAPPPRTAPSFALEAEHGGLVCGVDEAGRGPWAGPVCAAAVILDRVHVPEGIDDSKALTPAARFELEPCIKLNAVAWGVAFADVDEIAELNILHATGLAMRRAIAALAPAAEHALIDGNYGFPRSALPCPVRTVVRGDALSLSIAAASILAKTARDRLMGEMDVIHPGYGFARHKGYHAPEHVEALRRLGPSPIHRRDWAPIRLLLGGALGDAPATRSARAA